MTDEQKEAERARKKALPVPDPHEADLCREMRCEGCVACIPGYIP